MTVGVLRGVNGYQGNRNGLLNQPNEWLDACRHPTSYGKGFLQQWVLSIDPIADLVLPEYLAPDKALVVGVGPSRLLKNSSLMTRKVKPGARYCYLSRP